jgi:hypothetical protein
MSRQVKKFSHEIVGFGVTHGSQSGFRWRDRNSDTSEFVVKWLHWPLARRQGPHLLFTMKTNETFYHEELEVSMFQFR